MDTSKRYRRLPADEESHSLSLIGGDHSAAHISRQHPGRLSNIVLYGLLLISNFTFIYLWLSPASKDLCIRPDLIFCTLINVSSKLPLWSPKLSTLKTKETPSLGSLFKPSSAILTWLQHQQKKMMRCAIRSVGSGATLRATSLLELLR